MKNFFCLAQQVDVPSILYELHRGMGHKWRPLREKTQVLPIRENLAGAGFSWYTSAGLVNKIKPLVFDLARRVEATRIEDVSCIRFAPGTKGELHLNGGAYEVFEEYFIIVEADKGAILRCDEEQICPAPGQVWWVASNKEAVAQNYSASDLTYITVKLWVEQ